MPRMCGSEEAMIATDLLLAESDRAIATATGVVVARSIDREVGRVVAVSGRFLLLNAAGSVEEKAGRGLVPAEIREHLNGGAAQVVGASSDGEGYLVVDEGADPGTIPAIVAAGANLNRTALARFTLFSACGKD